MIRATLPKGMRDFNAETLRKRQYLFKTIAQVFEQFGFEPIETPAMENLSTLEGKYGDEGDKLLFRIINSGDIAEKLNQESKPLSQDRTINAIAEKGLRYDLTIPFARYVAMHRHQLVFPFKRYQMQPVWRADRPQRGRYREFYQCDADMVGSKSLLCETMLADIYKSVFEKLGISVSIHFNHRKILSAWAEVFGITPEKFTIFTTLIDKIDKIGIAKLKEELAAHQISESAAEIIDVAQQNLNAQELLKIISAKVSSHEHGKKGLEDITFLLHQHPDLKFNPALARGLDYYTGIIFEVKAEGANMGSIGGGGRYDNLTEVFGLPQVSGVGISFGVERIYDVMDELQLFKSEDFSPTHFSVLFINFGKESYEKVLCYLKKLRQPNLIAELYPDEIKVEKQMKYAQQKKIDFVAFVGAEELKTENIGLKNMQTGNQILCNIDNFLDTLKKGF